MSTYPARSRAFTLVEVLVVAAILALLIAILMPSLARARFQSRLVVCKSYLHQLGMGIISYAGDQGGIPHGPDVQAIPGVAELEANDGRLATNQVWTGPQQPAMRMMALGLLVGRSGAAPAAMYCPDDDHERPPGGTAQADAAETVARFLLLPLPAAR